MKKGFWGSERVSPDTSRHTPRPQHGFKKWFWGFGVLGSWGLGVLGFWGQKMVLGLWGFGVLGFWGFGVNIGPVAKRFFGHLRV